MERYELPDGWTWVSLESILEDHRGGVWGAPAQENEGYPVLRSTNMRGGKLDFSDVARCHISDKIAHEAALQPWDIIVSKSSGSPHLVGQPVLFDINPSGQIFLCSNFTMRLRPNAKHVNSRYLFCFLAGEKAQSERRRMAQDTTGLRNLKIREYLAQPLPLPPLPEQQHIVAKIENLFEQSRTARESLARITQLMAQFRRAVLASAFRGGLVEQDPNDEPADALLERVRAERRRKWEEDLRAKGKNPARYTYHEPEPPDSSELPELPDGWGWAILDLLAEIRNGVTKGRDLSRFETVEVPYLRVANVQSGYLDLAEIKTIKIKANELEKYRLQPNDILFTEGGDRDKLGRGTVWHGEIENCICQNHVHCARLYSTDLIPEWISLASQLPYARDFFWSAASQTVNLASLNSTNLKSFPVPLPPIAEQRRILHKIQELFAEADTIEQAASLALRRAGKIDQSILARAFRGELVQQDPDGKAAGRW